MLIESHYLFMNEATLTGESFPVEKKTESDPAEISLFHRSNALFMASNVVNGTGKALVIATGWKTQYGHIAQRIRFRPPETAFETGVRKFGYLLLEVTMILVLAIFAFNLYFQRPFLDSFLFQSRWQSG